MQTENDYPRTWDNAEVGRFGRLFLTLSAINLAFVICFSFYGYHLGLYLPFPHWFDRLITFSLDTTLGLFAIGLFGLLGSRFRKACLLSLLLNGFCLFLMAFLFTKG
jgi:hypothetical protein